MVRPAPDVTEAGPGAIIAGRYRLVGHLGEGGMGQVFVAEHLELGRRFALKVLRLERWSDELVARFRREAQALARLSTPHVAQVTDFGVADGVGPFYVMELVEGDTLESRLERGVLSPEEAIRIGIATASALAEVHAAGLVHRDLKPSNIALPARGPIEVKLLDFGLAAAVDDEFLTRLTKSQQVLGSLPYMPPEAFDGARPSPSLDLYALGVSLYEGLSGALPFFAPSTAAMIHQIMTAPVPPLVQKSAGVPPALAAVLERLLAKNPAERYPDAAAVASALSALSAGAVQRSVPLTVAASSARPLPPTALAPATSGGETHPGYGPAVGASAPTATQPVTPASRSTAPIPPRATSPGRFIVLAFVAGIVLALAAGVAVVFVLNATEPPETVGNVPAALPATVPITARPEADPDTEAATETETETETEAEARADSEIDPEPETATTTDPDTRVGPGMRRRSAAQAMTTTTTPAPTPSAPMRPTWRGDRPIIDDSEFD